MVRNIVLLIESFFKIHRKVIMFLKRSLFHQVGKNFVFSPNDLFSYSTISVGNDVYIGPGAKFSASKSSITIGNKVMFGPNVTIMGGDHNTSVVGSYMYDVNTKLPENDLPVVIEDDVWVGTGAIILKGVTVGTGSIVGAGSLVTKSVPSYSIVGGVPAKVIGSRFTEEELAKHKELIRKE